jgi:hypothetical protein
MKKLINLLPKAKAAGGLFVLGLGLFAFADNAKAEAVTYSTTGEFGNSSSSITDSGVTLSFTGAPSTATVTDLGTSDYVFGTFKYSAPVGSGDGAFSTSFTLHIYETVPTVTDGNVTPIGTITGELQRLPGGTGVTLTFGPTSSFSDGVGPGSITYTPNLITILGSNGGSGSQEFDGTIVSNNSTRTPLPTSAVAGTALLGLLAFGAKRRMAL